jgi:NitT/TauT family transport system permease protein
MTIAERLGNALKPNRVVDPATATLLVGAWAGVAILVWVFSPFETLPRPVEVWRAFNELWWKEGMGPELMATMGLILRALAYTVLISMVLSYATVVAAARPLVAAASKLRFLGITGLVFMFILVTGGGSALKVALLTFGMTTFFVTSMAAVVMEIPHQQFDHMRVIGASELRILWEVVILGTVDKAMEVMRQNVAMGWSMITMVEGISRAEGGIGAMLLNQNKHFRLADVYAILFAILVIGLVMDYAIGALTNVVCPYAALERVRR